MAPVELKAAIRQYILDHHLQGEDPGALADDTPLMTSGIIDSIGTLKLINFIESSFDVEFMPREIKLSRLETVEGICSAVQRKLAQ